MFGFGLVIFIFLTQKCLIFSAQIIIKFKKWEIHYLLKYIILLWKLVYLFFILLSSRPMKWTASNLYGYSM